MAKTKMKNYQQQQQQHTAIPAEEEHEDDTSPDPPPYSSHNNMNDNHDNDNDTDSVSSMNSTPTPPLTKVIQLARHEWPMLFVALCLMIGSEALGLYNPLLLAQAYDDLVNPTLDSSTRMSNIHTIMAWVLIIHTTGMITSFARLSIMTAAGERVVARLRGNLYAAILQQEIAFFDQHKSGELISRLSSDTTLLQEGTSRSLPEVLVGGIKVIVSLALMFWISPVLAAVMIGFVVVVMGIAVPFGGWLGRLSKQYQNVLGQAQTHSTEALQAMRTVQSFAAEKRELQRYQDKIGRPDQYKYWYPSAAVDTKTNPTTYSIGFFKSIVSSSMFMIIFGVGFGGMYVSLWYGFKLVNDGTITLGELTAFQSYIFTIGGSLGHTSQQLSKLIEAQGAAGRIFYLLERIPLIPSPHYHHSQHSNQNNKNKNEDDRDNNKEVMEKTSDISTDEEIGITAPPLTLMKPDSMQGAVAFHNVEFSYPSRPDVPILKNFSLSVPANQTCALVGASGAGKSTCIALLQRFYDVTGGSITVDGNDIRDLDLQWLRSNMAYVQQEPQLFGLSIRENIVYGVSRDVSQQELEDVAQNANAHEFISKWPNGYDTMVGERGVQLSGGQKQRIAIARALVRQPRILLLDEATSALDAESEHLVQEAIDKAVVGRTVLIVAHRLSTIQRAEQIVVVDNHQIVDVGTHRDLLDRCEKYQELIKRQSIITNTTTMTVTSSNDKDSNNNPSPGASPLLPNEFLNVMEDDENSKE